jgi:hypothetical protein
MKTLFLALAVAFLALSCATPKRCIERYGLKIDTIITVSYRDSIIPVYIHSTDTVRAYSTIRDTLIIHSGTAHAQTWVIHDTLKLNVWQTDTTLQVKVDSCIKVINEKQTQIVTIQKKYVPLIWKQLGSIGVFAILVAIGLIIWLIKKK